MSGMSDREKAIRQKLKDDFDHYASKCLKLRSKAGSIIPFQLNRSQRFLHERLEKQRKEKGKVRALVLKGRQVGISTYIAGRFYWRTSHTKGFRTFILTHLEDATSNLFGIAKRYHENCPDLVKPATSASNARELVFNGLGSGYKVSTAGSKDVGRSETIQMFHGSEMAFWPNADEHSAGIGQAIANAPGTEDIRESTANGIGNAFHGLWKAAERGDSEFEAIFIPWFWHEEYETDPPEGWAPPDEFKEYQEIYGLDDRQTYWAFLKNRDLSVMAGGGPDEINWKFRQEYPANAEEAFQTSGTSFIPAISVLRARKNKVDVPYGPIILGVDPARGGGDKTGIIDRQGRRIGGHVALLIDRDDTMAVAGEVQRIAKPLIPLGLAKIVVDITGLGSGVYDRLREQMGAYVEGINFASRAYNREAYANRRAEMWDMMRQWLEDPAGVQVPDSDLFQADLTSAVREKGATHFNSSGQLVLESKDHIKERLNHSPDIGDAAALTFAVDMGLVMDAWGEEGDAARCGNASTGY